jgi:GTPase
VTPLSVDDYVDGVVTGDRAVLGRAITLIESRRTDHRAMAREVLSALLDRTGGAHRVGVSGVPGVGKSTFLEAMGTRLTAAGHRVAVLAVDPTSGRTGGSILGDKTRMADLAVDPDAFIRPSPSAGTLGGVASATRETILLCEAAGYDVVLVETVGVGQSETVVAGMVDTFLLLLLPGAGDDLQGIKRGILELADVLAVTKDDADVARARAAQRDYANAVALLTPPGAPWQPPVRRISARTGEGLDDLWADVVRHREVLVGSGVLAEKRRHQRVDWWWSLVDERLRAALRAHPAVATRLPELEAAVLEDRMPPSEAAAEVLRAFGVD